MKFSDFKNSNTLLDNEQMKNVKGAQHTVCSYTHAGDGKTYFFGYSDKALNDALHNDCVISTSIRCD